MSTLFPDEEEENRIILEMSQRPSTIAKTIYAIEQLATDDKFEIGGFWYNGYGQRVLKQILEHLKP